VTSLPLALNTSSTDGIYLEYHYQTSWCSTSSHPLLLLRFHIDVAYHSAFLSINFRIPLLGCWGYLLCTSMALILLLLISGIFRSPHFLFFSFFNLLTKPSTTSAHFPLILFDICCFLARVTWSQWLGFSSQMKSSSHGCSIASPETSGASNTISDGYRRSTAIS